MQYKDKAGIDHMLQNIEYTIHWNFQFVSHDNMVETK